VRPRSLLERMVSPAPQQEARDPLLEDGWMCYSPNNTNHYLVYYHDTHGSEILAPYIQYSF
jgi:hypothetical protein